MTIEKFMKNAFNYIKVNGEYTCDDPSKPTKHKTDEEVYSIMSDVNLFIDVYDILNDEAHFQGFEVSEILDQIPYVQNRRMKNE